MKALVFHGPGQTSWQDVPDPAIKDAADAIVRVDAVTICGTDLHIVKGDVPEVSPGRVLGHEAVGTVVETGGDVRTVRPGDRVLISCISACGRCRFCREARYGQCREGGGWVLGHTMDGTQAEYVRVPFADLSVHPLPSTLPSDEAVLLADIFPTAYEVGVLNGNVRPGDTVVVVGAGPIGLAVIATASLCSPYRVIAVDLAASRLAAARDLGADATVGAEEGPEKLVEDLTDGLGADVVVEAVGVPEAFEMCTRMVRPGGPRRQHRRPRQARDPPPRRPVDQGRHHHHRPRRHPLDARPAPHDGRGPAAGGGDGHPPVRAGQDGGGVRRLLPGR